MRIEGYCLILKISLFSRVSKLRREVYSFQDATTRDVMSRYGSESIYLL